MQDLMIDIETLSTRPDAAIISVGATEFSRSEPGKLGLNFCMCVKWDDALKYGKADGETLKWWMTQDWAARKWYKTEPLYDLPLVLAYLKKFWFRTGANRLWCHGANFDEPILTSAMRVCGIDPPWRYNEVRDDRTLFDIVGVEVKGDYPDLIPHHPLHDAIRQAYNVQTAFKILKEGQK